VAIIEASLSFYVEEDYVASGYVEGQPLVAASSMSVTGGIIHEGVVALDSSFTQTATAEIDIAVGADLDTTSTLVTTATNSIEALASVGMITNWSALGSPTWAGQLSADIQSDMSASGTKLIGAELTLSFSSDQTTDAEHTLGSTLTLDATTSTSIESELYRNAGLDVNAEFTTSITPYTRTGKTFQQLHDYFTTKNGNTSYAYAGVRDPAYTSGKLGESKGFWPCDVTEYLTMVQSGIMTDMNTAFKLYDDFTVEGFFNPVKTSDNDWHYLFSSATQLYDTSEESVDTNYNTGFEVKVYGNNSDGFDQITIVMRDQRNELQYLSMNKTFSHGANTWKHYAIARNGNDVSVYYHGVLQTGWSITETIDGVAQTPRTGTTGLFSGSLGHPTTNSTYNEQTKFIIGDDGRWTSSNSFSFMGYIDEVRVSQVDRSNAGASFTVPTSPYLNDEDTLTLLHMDGETYDYRPGVPPYYYDLVFGDDETLEGNLVVDGEFTQTAEAILYKNGAADFDASFTQDTDSDVTFTTGPFTLDAEFAQDTTGINLVGAESELTAEFNQQTRALVDHITPFSVDAVFTQETDSINYVNGLADFDASFTQDTTATNITNTTFILDAETTFEATGANVVTGVALKAGEFTTVIGAEVVQEAIFEPTATFTQTSYGELDSEAVVDTSAEFTQQTTARAYHNASINYDVASISQVTDSSITATTPLEVDAAFDFTGTPEHILGTSINLSATFEQETDYEGIWDGTIDNSASFTQFTDGSNSIEAAMDLSATFHVTPLLLLKLVKEQQLM